MALFIMDIILSQIIGHLNGLHEYFLWGVTSERDSVK